MNRRGGWVLKAYVALEPPQSAVVSYGYAVAYTAKLARDLIYRFHPLRERYVSPDVVRVHRSTRCDISGLKQGFYTPSADDFKRGIFKHGVTNGRCDVCGIDGEVTPITVADDPVRVMCKMCTNTFKIVPQKEGRS